MSCEKIGRFYFSPNLDSYFAIMVPSVIRNVSTVLVTFVLDRETARSCFSREAPLC